MFRTVRRAATLTVVATGAVVLAGAGLAAAHIEPDPPAVEAGRAVTVGFVVEHGCGDNDTTGMDIKLPAGITDATAAKPGWQVTVADGVVRFADGVLDHHTEDSFDISFTAPATPGFVTFPTVQRCGDTEQPWLDETVEGQPEPEHPAPRLEITQGPPTSDELTVPPDDDADAAATTTIVTTTTAATTTAAPTTAAPAATVAPATTAAPTTTATPTTTAASTTTPATTTTIAVTTTTVAKDDEGGSNAGWWIGGVAAVVVIGAGTALALRARRTPDA
jgi:periplasmic copper chaperone A